MPGLGEDFRAAREARGLSLSDVSSHIHIRTAYLDALETEDYRAIGAQVYVRGFIRTYARFLGLDPEGAVARFNESANASAPATAAPSATVSSTPRSTRRPVATVERPARSGPSPWVWLGGLVALGLVGYVLYNYYLLRTGREGAQTAPVAATTATAAPSTAVSTAAPAVTATARPTAVARGVHVRLLDRSWVRVVVDGRTAIEGIFPAGTDRTFAGKTVTVRAGNAGGVEVTTPTQSAAKLGGTGDVVERSFSLPGG